MNKFKVIVHSLLIATLAAGVAFSKEKPASEKGKDGVAKTRGVSAYLPDRYQI